MGGGRVKESFMNRLAGKKTNKDDDDTPTPQGGGGVITTAEDGGEGTNDSADQGPSSSNNGKLIRRDGLLLVDFPFEMTLDHPPLDLSQMFEASALFDRHELDEEGNPLPKELTVDVLSVERTQTTLRVTPSKGLTYDEMAGEMERMVEKISDQMFKGDLRPQAIRWDIYEYGISSDQRRSYRRVS